jgi:hypothetical protein
MVLRPQPPEPPRAAPRPTAAACGSGRALGAVLAVSGAAAALLSATPAAAYCIATTCDPTAPAGSDSACELVGGCITGGEPLHWPGRCTSYSVHRDGSQKRGIDYDLANQVIGSAFKKWTTADCGGEPTSLQVYDTEPVDCARREYNDDGPNANLWVFRDTGWPYPDDESHWTLALTTVTFHVDTGEIYDADVEVNTYEHQITAAADDVQNDFASIVTHEAGHVLGLGHSTDPLATMFASYLEGDTRLRSLNDDDVAGICSLYPSDRAVTECNWEPRNGFSAQCGSDEKGCFCAAPAERHAPGAWPVALLGAWLLAWRRYRRLSEP